MIGPRNSVVRTLLGEEVPLDDLLTDQSEFIDTEACRWDDLPELWVDRLYEGHYCEDEG